IDPNLDCSKIPLVLAIALLVAISTSSLGVIIASRLSSIEGFGLIMNLITMPLIFGSGVFFPIEAMPIWMQIIAYMSPLTYGVDAARELMLGISSIGILYDLIALTAISIVLIGIAMVLFEKITIG
ncbi:MAG: ABC transporter permease, partial [Candidatus Njordarchaeota archaeon]